MPRKKKSSDAPRGAKPPAKPRAGMSFWLQWGSCYSLGKALSISKVNTRSFYVASDGKQRRYLLVEWEQWLERLFAEGKLFFDGQQLEPPPALVGPDEAEQPVGAVDPLQRDYRFFRAAREVLQYYKIQLEAVDARTVEYLVTGLSRRYRVFISKDWSTSPWCECPDARARADQPGGAFCKHAIAVLMQDDANRGQLLELLL